VKATISRVIRPFRGKDSGTTQAINVDKHGGLRARDGLRSFTTGAGEPAAEDEYRKVEI
jgi:hypothetical protein